MAKQTKLVNVVYKVNKAELEATKQTIKEVDAEIKKSAKSMDSLSNASTSSGLKISSTIQGMQLQMAQLKARIELTNVSDQKRLNELKAQYDQVKKKVDEYNNSLFGSEQKLQSLSQTMMSFRSVAIATFGVILAKQVGDAAVEMAKLKGETDGVARGFYRQIPRAAALMQDLRAATHGTVTDVKLMTKTIEAFHLGVDVEKLPKILEFAAVYAQQTGKSMDYVVESIVNGIGRKSIRWLDNLGFSASRLKDEMGGVAVTTKSTAELTAVVAKLANEELDKMGGYASTSKTEVDKLAVSWDKFKRSFANRHGDDAGAFMKLLDSMVGGARRLIATEKELAAERAAGEAADILNKVKTTDQLAKEIQSTEALLALDKQRFEDNKKRSGGFLGFEGAARHDQLRREILMREELLKILQHEEKVMKEMDDPSNTTPGLIEKLSAEIENLQEQVKQATSEQGITKLNDQIGKLQTELERLQNLKTSEADPFVVISPIEVKSGLDQVTDEYAASLDDWDKMLNEYYQEQKKQIDAKYNQEQIDAQEHANLMLEIDEQASNKRKELAKQEAAYKQSLLNSLEQYGFQSLTRILQYTLINRENDISDLEDYYSRQINAAGDNEKAKKRIEVKRDRELERARAAQAQRDRDDALTKIAIDSAVGFIRALITPPVPNFALASIIAGAGAIEAATVKQVSAKNLSARAFKSGKVDIDGPGTTTSDSISARISKHESVINADATLASKSLLTAINNRELDDRIMAQLVSGHSGGTKVAFDDRRIVAELQKRHDVVKQGHTLYETFEEGKGFKRTVRSKIQGY